MHIKFKEILFFILNDSNQLKCAIANDIKSVIANDGSQRKLCKAER
jgi:hypothetical protein